MSILKSLVSILAVSLPISAVAQETGPTDPRSLRARHEIEVSIGLLSALSAGSEVSVGSVEMTSEVNGIIGSLGYSYWFADEWAATVSLGVANADVSTSASGWNAAVESAVVIPLLFGVKYKPLGLAVALGPYFGFASDVRAGTTTGAESYSEAALGTRAGVGMDLSLSTRFALGFTLGYRLVSDFGRRIGSEKNHSSPEFSLSLGIVLGRGQE
jgi:outer membrane protein W